MPQCNLCSFSSVKLKRSNTITANAGGGGGSGLGQSPSFHPQQHAHAVMAKKWSNQTMTSPQSDSGSSNNTLSYHVCLECKAVIENISQHKSAQARRAALNRQAAAAATSGGGLINYQKRSQAVVPPRQPVFME